MPNHSINTDLCIKCKLCMEVCPCNVIGIKDNNEMYFIRDREHICLECGQCMAICKSMAISANGLSYEKDFTELPKTTLKFQEFNQLISSRRSIRNFKDKPVSEGTLHQLLESLSYTPYGAAPEKINITIVHNRQQIEEALPHIEEFLDNIVIWMESPVARFLIKRKKGKETFNTIRNHLYPIAKQGNYKLEFGDRITRSAPALIIIHAEQGAEEHTHNSLIFATYLMLAAHALGLGASMNGIVPAAINKVEEVRNHFSVPKGNEAIIALILGYPKYKYQRSIIRKIPKVNIL
jgi:nitroreductase/NAD-dependent dihydropyrimidine dehydrogenase PreA subunit